MLGDLNNTSITNAQVQEQQLREEVTSPPTDGVHISGLWLDGARWDAQGRCLAEAEPGVMLSPLPVVHVRPQRDAATPEGCYFCPLYKTSARCVGWPQACALWGLESGGDQGVHAVSLHKQEPGLYISQQQRVVWNSASWCLASRPLLAPHPPACTTAPP
jgi:hypothetical protein